MPNSYGLSMRAFKKLFKPPFPFLQSEDFCLFDSLTECAENFIRIKEILESLGFSSRQANQK